MYYYIVDIIKVNRARKDGITITKVMSTSRRLFMHPHPDPLPSRERGKVVNISPIKGEGK
jgi:hypothetical protein